MSDAMLDLFPEANVYHIGLFREKISLQPVECKLSCVFLSPMTYTAKRCDKPITFLFLLFI